MGVPGTTQVDAPDRSRALPLPRSATACGRLMEDEGEQSTTTATTMARASPWDDSAVYLIDPTTPLDTVRYLLYSPPPQSMMVEPLRWRGR